jgi:DNA-binding response OmpR family regulator
MEETSTAPTPKLVALEKDKKKRAAATPIQVLLVEDDPDSAELMRIGLLEDSTDPFQVEWSPNLFNAMKRLTEPGIDAILLDLGMPELKGRLSYVAIEAAADPIIPVVILTGDDRSQIRRLTMERGASDFLVKGQSTARELRQTVRQAVQSNWVV